MSFRVLVVQLAAVSGLSMPGCLADSGVSTEDESAPAMSGAAHILDDIDLNSVVQGRFQDRVRVYGYTVEVKAGAVLDVAIRTKAGSNSSDTAPGAALDTVAAVHGPMKGTKRGPQIAYSDDTDESTAAELPPIEIEQDGQYLVTMSSWSDPGNGTYEIETRCTGTEFQCRRPVNDLPCEAGTQYIMGGPTVETTTWSKCNVVLLETTTVAADSILTVRPGVTVSANYLGTTRFGDVSLVVNGTLQAVGTERHPVLFTGLRDGWKGIDLRGPSNTLEHVYVEEAEIGVTTTGRGNTFRDLVVDASDTGIRFDRGSTDNIVQRVHVANVRNGIQILGSGAAIDDSVVTGTGVERGTGIWAEDGQASRFRRALVAGFDFGIWSRSTELEVQDSTIVNNKKGVTVTGDPTGVHAAVTCPTFPQVAPPSPPRPTFPTSWRPDPIFTRCDIIANSEYGIRIDSPELLVVQQSNIRRNGAGIVISSDSLHPDSRIERSNILDNGTGAEVDSWHLNGTLDISDNYWAQISDPELSASWDVDHALQHTCTNVPTGNWWQACTQSGGQYTCGAYTCTNSNGWRCTVNVTENRSGQLVFTGFSPVELTAGPDLSTCIDDVRDERGAQGLSTN